MKRKECVGVSALVSISEYNYLYLFCGRNAPRVTGEVTRHSKSKNQNDGATAALKITDVTSKKKRKVCWKIFFITAV